MTNENDTDIVVQEGVNEPVNTEGMYDSPSEDRAYIARFERLWKSRSGSAWQAIRIVLVFSAAVSAAWFWNVYPSLFFDATTYPTIAPLISAVLGVASMEAMIYMWTSALQRMDGTLAQRVVSYLGLVLAIVASAFTTIFALMEFSGTGGVTLMADIDRLLDGPVVPVYVGIQVVLGVLYFTIFDPKVSEAMHLARISSYELQAKRLLEKTAAEARLNGMKAFTDDFKKLGRDSAPAARKALEDEIKKGWGNP